MASPDLSLTEHLCDVVECDIHILDVQPTHLQQLSDVITLIWNKIPEESLQHQSIT